MIRIAIADDETLFRKGMQILLADFDGLEVSMEAGNGRELLDQLEKTEELPDVILLDLNMPELNGVETAKILQEKFPEIKVIVLSTYFSKEFISKMLELGASGYLPKNSAPEEVEQAIREVHEKGFSYTQPVMEVVRDSLTRKKKSRVAFGPDLTSREKEILELICKQYTTQEIGEKLFISSRTVDGHRNNLLQKLGCRNTAGLVVFAVQNQLVDVSPDAFWEK